MKSFLAGLLVILTIVATFWVGFETGIQTQRRIVEKKQEWHGNGKVYVISKKDL